MHAIRFTNISITCKFFFFVHHQDFGSWKVCKKMHIADFDPNLLQHPSILPVSTATTTTTSVVRQKTSRNSSTPAAPIIHYSTSDRIPFGFSPFCRSPVLGCSENAGVSSSRTLSEQQQQQQRLETKRVVKSEKKKAVKELVNNNKEIPTAQEGSAIFRDTTNSVNCR